MLKAIKNCEMPKETWTSYDIRVLYKANSFSEARLKLRWAEDDTDLQSEAEEGRPEKRKTRTSGGPHETCWRARSGPWALCLTHLVFIMFVSKLRPKQRFLSSQEESDEEPVKRKPVLPKAPSIPPLPSVLREAISSSEISPPSQLDSLQPFHALGPPEPSYNLASQSSRQHGTPEPSDHLASQSSRHHGTPEPSYHLAPQSSRHHGTPEPIDHLAPQSSRHHGTPEPSDHLASQLSRHHGTPEPSYHLASQSSRHHGTPEPSYHLASLQPSRAFGTSEPSYHLAPLSSRQHGTPEPSYHLAPQSSRQHGTPEPSYHLAPQSSRQHGTPEPFHLASHAASEMDLPSVAALLREIIAKQEVMCDMQRNLLRIVQDLSSTPTPHGHHMDRSFLPLRDAEALLALDRDIKTKPEKRKDLVPVPLLCSDDQPPREVSFCV
ncbi:histone-lysine N-methyltransferase 2D-like [Alosa alosa]|uniref:histone-lysine N-methyltransferase 2D-like n=1 Tax=Alosa alosa TaxID=278164 RepID=UPI0020155477|nr:histone-lysine N-methyltransferase 2D-like [Alosa alosa]